MKIKKLKKAQILKIAHITNTSLIKHTFKNWDEWIEILDQMGAKVLTHKEIFNRLQKKFKLSIWWAHEVTSGYEIHIGRKIAGRNAKGLFSMTTTKILNFNQKTVWKYLVSREGQDIWLKPMSPLVLAQKNSFEVEGGIFGEIRTIKSPSRIRLMWHDSDWLKPTFLQIYVLARPNEKSMLVFQHEGITTAIIKESLRERWKNATEKLIFFISKKEK